MRKTIILVNYKGCRKEYIIPSFDNVFIICIHVISGDEVAQIFYKDGSTRTLDSDDGDRRMSFYDRTIIIKPEEVDRFSNLQGSSYNRFFS